jgi:hypothetical protein
MANKGIYNLNKRVPFNLRPEDINRSGANRNRFTQFVKECENEGLKPPSKSEYYKMVGILMQLSDAELKAKLDDKENSQWIRWIIADLFDKNKRTKLMSEFRDFMYGKSIEVEKTETLQPFLPVDLRIKVNENTDGTNETNNDTDKGV